MRKGNLEFVAFMLRGGQTFNLHRAQQRWLLRIFLLISFPVIAGLAIFHVIINYRFLAMIQVPLALALPIIYIMLNRLEWLRRLEFACMVIITILLLSVVIDGGVDQTALFWVPIFPVLAFFILGLKRGWNWVIGFGLTLVAIAVLMDNGVLESPYEHSFDLEISVVIYLFYAALAALFEALRELRQDDLERKNNELGQLSIKLDNARQQLEEKVIVRTESLAKSNAELRHEIVEHERSKQALEESERRYLQAQKMEALGTLVGGIAHDFNNMLSGINANLFLIKRRCGENSETTKHLDNIDALSAHAADMIRQLLTFARKDAVEYQRFDAASFFNEAVKLGRVSVPSYIRFITDIERDKTLLNGNSTQLQQVLFNLINNARDAVEGVEDPWIRVELRNVEIDHVLRMRHPELTEEHYLRLTVSDNGTGIPPEILHKVFEPFFTTKQTGKGTGLGLAMCYGAAQRHGGTIDIQSESGQGTQVHFYLPLATEQAENDTTTSSDNTLTPAPPETTILIVDDEEAIRSAHRSVLEELGFQVIEAEHGQQAVEQFGNRTKEIGLVLMDIKMPVMDGFAAAAKIRELKPDQPLVFLTGFRHDDQDSGGQLPFEAPILEKPVTVQTLNETIHSQLRLPH